VRSSSGRGDAPPGLGLRAERYRRALARICRWAFRAAAALEPATIILYGSYARGDFNVWSDVDVIVVSPAFRGVGFKERWRLIPWDPELPVEAVAWTPEEARAMLSKPSWRRALEGCLLLADNLGLAGGICAGSPCRAD
jgi:predicted nucleotidyltransferase